MYQSVVKTASAKMDKTLEVLKSEFSKVRTGRASATLLDPIMVDYYGTPTPLNQVGTLSVPEPRLITVQPWERNLIPQIEKAILKSDLGLNPSSDGQIIRIPLPPLTEERRKELCKHVKRLGEDAKVAIRTVRRDGNDELKKLEKNKDISEDELKRGEKEIQDITDQHVKKVDELVSHKEKDVMEI